MANRSFAERWACDANSRRSNGGMSFEELCRDYDVTTADIQAAIQYDEELIRSLSAFSLAKEEQVNENA
jgi:hypothetical protein